MAAHGTKFREDPVFNDMEPGHDTNGYSEHIDNGSSDKTYVPTVSSQIAPVVTTSRKFEPPVLVRNMSPEIRIELEARLKRKIDLRLLPMIVLMYIMNYLDRVCWNQFEKHYDADLCTE